jgi:hypothetical protein
MGVRREYFFQALIKEIFCRFILCKTHNINETENETPVLTNKRPVLQSSSGSTGERPILAG